MDFILVFRGDAKIVSIYALVAEPGLKYERLLRADSICGGLGDVRGYNRVYSDKFQVSRRIPVYMSATCGAMLI